MASVLVRVRTTRRTASRCWTGLLRVVVCRGRQYGGSARSVRRRSRVCSAWFVLGAARIAGTRGCIRRRLRRSSVGSGLGVVLVGRRVRREPGSVAPDVAAASLRAADVRQVVRADAGSPKVVFGSVPGAGEAPAAAAAVRRGSQAVASLVGAAGGDGDGGLFVAWVWPADSGGRALGPGAPSGAAVIPSAQRM
jgi:hypothetical protein